MEILEFITANIPAAVCLVCGVALVGLEFFLPGFGLPGISGIILIIVGIFLGASSVLEAVILIIIVLAILGVLVAIALKSATNGRMAKSNLILSDELDRESGFSSVSDLEYFMGREGEVMTTLRPAGMADFDGVKLDVVSEAEYIDKGEKVRVIAVEGRKILVRKI
ncbi:MAG: hypothetical protein IJB92_00275 [Clostridia bacterium]|nr:hypothetical protein [Clostridia bacterium]